MNRRDFMKMLGVAGAATVAGEQLSYLIRQPTSVFVPEWRPYTATFRVTGLQAEDSVWLHTVAGKKLVGRVGGLDADLYDITVPIWKPEDAQVIVSTRTLTPVPYANIEHACAQITQGGLPEYDVIGKPDTKWEDTVSQHKEFVHLERRIASRMKYRLHSELEFEDLG